MGQAHHQAIHDWIAAGDEDDGNRAARLLHYPRRRGAIGQDHVRRQRHQARRAGSYPVGVAQTPMKIDLNIAADCPAELLEPLPERRGAELPCRIVLGVEHQHADAPHSVRLLRMRSERPYR
jgi:hypothetical protein